MSFKNIIIGTDFSDKSTEAATAAGILAKQTGAAVHLVHVCNYFEDSVPPFTNTNIVAEGKTFKELVESNLQTAFSNQIEKAGLDINNTTTAIEYGNPKEQLSDYIEKNKANLLVLGFHGHNILSKIFLGSTTNQMLRASSCDVLIIKKPLAEPSFQKIISCLDFSNITDAVLAKSKSLAKSFSSHLVLANIIEPNPEVYYALAQADGFDGIANMKDALEQEKRDIHEKIKKSTDSFNAEGIKSESLIEETKDFKTAKGILDLAKSQEAELLVLGAHSQSTMDRFLFGSVSEAVVNDSQRNVYIVKS